MPKPLDPLWQYGEPKDGTNMQNLKCKLCGHHMTRGISRLKYHLAKLPRHDVSLCTGVTLEIMRSTHDSIHVKNKKKDEIAANGPDLATSGLTRGSRVSMSTNVGASSGRGSTDSPIERGGPHPILLHEQELEHNLLSVQL